MHKKVSEAKVRNRYFKDLISLIWNYKKDGPCPSEYEMMLYVVHTVKFYSLVSRDENRESDARDLRAEITEKYKEDVTCLEGPVTLLEVMVALARRMDKDVCGTPSAGNQTSRWFWMMVNNLGIIGKDPEKVQKICEKVVERRYKNDGKGSLFGNIKNEKRVLTYAKNAGFVPEDAEDVDIRKVELWFQMLWWYQNT